ncbi:hypothetical protein [Azoarcus sp. DD4]|uniref:hypothetical protein n=1 Tax=Azoarcus sp. DD4 TaxID=2027405 RepID=UPI00197A796F|nr:hypothetical protein [Azoarcus sp. DD4]
MAKTLREWRQDGPSGIFVVDDGGRELLGREVSAMLMARVRLALAEDGPRSPRELVLADGRRYLSSRRRHRTVRRRSPGRWGGRRDNRPTRPCPSLPG